MQRSRVFINYRSEDTGETASRLFNELERELEPDQAFIDHERIQAGSDWPDSLCQEVKNASVVFCLIGRHWLASHDPETGERRLSMHGDWVRCELETALEHQVPIVPILVDDATPPSRKAVQSLPALSALPDLQCLSLRRKDWAADFRKILDLLVDRGFRRKEETRVGVRNEAVQVRRGHSDLIRQYRRRLSGLYDRWDLSSIGITPSEAGSKPLEVKLDDIYLPLRLARTYNPEIYNDGMVQSPLALLTREKPVIIRGVGGAGKTTWVRWTFRRLLTDEGAFPISVELRRLAASWGKPTMPHHERSIEGYVKALIAEHAGPEWQELFSGFLRDDAAPRPILFVDGWDELGTLGEEVRFKLVGFQKDYPRVLVVATSRPYGEGRPSESDGYEVLDIQPLSRDEIEYFARRFYDRCWGEDERAADEYRGRFLVSLDRSPDAMSLARTVLLLTMMLFISRVKQLPDKRHLLYRSCVEHLLTALPERKREDGVLIAAVQWRPQDTEEILRIAANLAFALQSRGYSVRSPIVLSWDEMKTLLPNSWRDEQQTRFLNWLISSAGLLVDRADNSLSFAHLSFQEYLAAWHMHATIEGAEERTKACLEKLDRRTWWETLRLWAALVGGQQPEKVAPIVEGLLDSNAGLCLAGTILADGAGGEDLFVEWICRYLDLVRVSLPPDHEFVARAWLSSRQEQRRSLIHSQLDSRAVKATWVEWVRYREFAKSIELMVKLQLPGAGKNARVLVEAAYGQLNSARHFALGRLLCSGSPLWPGEPRELALLQVWPGPRLLLGHRLQVLASLGAQRVDLIRAMSIDAGPQIGAIRIQRSIVKSEFIAAATWLGSSVTAEFRPARMFFKYALMLLNLTISDVRKERHGPHPSPSISIDEGAEFLTRRGRQGHATLLRKLSEFKIELNVGGDKRVLKAIDFFESLNQGLSDIALDWLRTIKALEFDQCEALRDFLFAADLQASEIDDLGGRNRFRGSASVFPVAFASSEQEPDIAWDLVCCWMRGSLEPAGPLGKDGVERTVSDIAPGRTFNLNYRGATWARECAGRWLAAQPDKLPAREHWDVATLAGLQAALGSMRYGAMGVRGFLSCEPSRDCGATGLLASACRLSLHPGRASGKFKRALAEYPSDSDPLWRALARQVARRATEEDKSLLIDLAGHPEKREPPLRWGLQYAVRGDVILDDGTEITLDELAREAGLAPPPLLIDPAADSVLWRKIGPR